MFKKIVRMLIDFSEERENESVKRSVQPFHIEQLMMSDKELQAFHNIIDLLSLLSDETILKVEAVMLCGRGDYPSVEEALQDLYNDYPIGDGFNRDIAIEYIAGKAPLHEYLKCGLEKFN